MLGGRTGDLPPSGTGSGAVSHPLAVSRRVACCSWGAQGGAIAAASLPRTWVPGRKGKAIGGIWLDTTSQRDADDRRM